MRIWILSDIHVDFIANQSWLDQLSDFEYQDDLLILAGDVTHNLDLFKSTLISLRKKFKMLFFVPGNHDLWLRDNLFSDSIEKFHHIQQFCKSNDIKTSPELVSNNSVDILIVPLFSWYHLPHQTGSLYITKPGEGSYEEVWNDSYFVKWPSKNFKPVEYFFELNKQQFKSVSADLVITFSHFLARQENMFYNEGKIDIEKMKKFDRNPKFNFSMIAGSKLIDEQLRLMGSKIHVYGHQHINHDRIINGVRYVAHCLGYPAERLRGMIEGIAQGLKQVWP